MIIAWHPMRVRGGFDRSPAPPVPFGDRTPISGPFPSSAW